MRGAGNVHRHLQQVGLRLQQDPRAGEAAVGAQRGERRSHVGGHRSGELRDGGGDPLGDRADDVAALGGQLETGQHAAGIRLPVRGAEAGQRWHEHHTS